MNREIKFRAWHPEEKKMYHLQKRNYFGSTGIDDPYVGCEHAIWMQFTGLQDKNGKDIYEGDIVKFHYFYSSLGASLGAQESEHELTGTVEWGEYGWGLSAIRGQHWEGYTGYSAGQGASSFVELCSINEEGIHEESFEVIGNIFLNPDLLNK